MKRYMAILGFVFVGILAGLLVRGIPIVLHVNAGGEAVATQNGDVNGDSMLDMSDAVYLLIHLFNGGPQPAAFAQMEPADLRGVEDSLESIADNFDRFVGLQCEQSLDRFVWREDRTVVDTCKNLMWTDETVINPENIEFERVGFTFAEAIDYVENLTYSGYSDWRLPTITELTQVLTNNHGLSGSRYALGFNIHYLSPLIWTSTRDNNGAWLVNFGDRSAGNAAARHSTHFRTPFDRSNACWERCTADEQEGRIFVSGFNILAVRDITPEE